MLPKEELIKWIDEYYDTRSQLKRPPKDLWGEYVLTPNQANILLRTLLERHLAAVEMLSIQQTKEYTK